MNLMFANTILGSSIDIGKYYKVKICNFVSSPWNFEESKPLGERSMNILRSN